MTNSPKVLIIAEAGVNHNGSLDNAKALVDAAKIAGADIVKFQTFKAANLVTKKAPKAQYQVAETGNSESQFDMLKKLELSFDEFLQLADYCRKKNIEFLSTAFDEECLDFLVSQTGIRRIKIPSGELTNGPLIAAFARTMLPLIVSTGMATLAEIEATLDLIAWSRQSNSAPTHSIKGLFKSIDQAAFPVSILHCTTEYPAPFDELNLRAIESIRKIFGLNSGYSDHSQGILAPVAAVGMGATIIEKHFTLSKDLPGPDHKASLDPVELAEMIKQIRTVEVMLGHDFKQPTDREMKNALVARKSITAKRPIKAGEQFSEETLTTKRPGTGISPMKLWTLLGKTASKDYETDDLIEESIDP